MIIVSCIAQFHVVFNGMYVRHGSVHAWSYCFSVILNSILNVFISVEEISNFDALLKSGLERLSLKCENNANTNFF
jgi:hypothetical protein